MISAVDTTLPEDVLAFLDDTVSRRGRRHWLWKYSRGSAASPTAYYWRDGDGRVLGFIGLMRTGFHAGGDVHPAAWFVDWYVAPGQPGLGVPGLVVVAISLRHDPGELLRRAVCLDPRPVLFLEQKLLCARRLQIEPPPGLCFDAEASDTDVLYPTAVWRPAAATGDVTVITCGGMTEIVERALGEAFVEDEIVAEYIVPTQLAPLRLDPILASVRRTGRLVVVEEGTGPWGFGSELVAAVVEAMADAPPRCARVGAHHLPIPGARPAEEAVLPDAARVVAALRQVMQ